MKVYDLVGCYPDCDDAFCPEHCPDTDACEDEHAAIFAGTEYDTPTHCATCEELLPHELTPDGYQYVRDAIESGDGRPEILEVWKAEYL